MLVVGEEESEGVLGLQEGWLGFIMQAQDRS